jgi:hypothetical protein
MACMTLTAQLLAMATTQLAHVAHEEYVPTWQFESLAEHSSLRMSWVVVTDSDGKPQLRMRWTSDC